MNLEEFKKQYICKEIGITDDFGRVFSFIDFSNVNKWFDNDNQDCDNEYLGVDERISIDMDGLRVFTEAFSERIKIYYGGESSNEGSVKFMYRMRKEFGKRAVVTKDIQRIKHYVEVEDRNIISFLKKDASGKVFVEIRKCNFDVEISVDALKMLQHYDTFCLFSGDADFVYLNEFLRKNGKKIIIVKGGYITAALRESADLIINAQSIKKYITRKITKA